MMIGRYVFTNGYVFLKKALDITVNKQEIASHNIANIDTIGFKPKEMDFQETLKLEMKKNEDLIKTHPNHLSPDNSYNINEQIKENQENPDIDKEMTDMAENNLQYRFIADRLAGKATKMKMILNE